MEEYRRPGVGVIPANGKGIETDHANDMIAKYIQRASMCFDLDSEVTQVSTANEYLKYAEDAMNDFNRVEDTDTDTKNIILVVGMYNAYKAFYYCRSCMETYSKKGEQLIFSNDKTENEKILDQYNKLSGELFILNLHGLLEDLLKLCVSGQTYIDHRHASDFNDGFDYRAAAITQHGLKIYHLKMTIDYCYEFIRCLNKHHNNSPVVDKINQYLKKAEGKFNSLNIYINDECASHLDEISNNVKHQLCVRSRNMLNDYFDAIILTIDSNIDVENITFESKIEMIIKSNIKDKFVRIVEEESNKLENIYIIANSPKENEININPRALLVMIDNCIEIGNSIREYITKLVINKMK